MSDLLKSAIADAKAIRQTALANARIALQEAFTPRLQKMISDKIQHEVEGEEDFSIPEIPSEEGGEVSVEPEIASPEAEVPVEEPAEVPVEEPTEEIPVEDPTAEPVEEPVDEDVKFGGKVTSDAGQDPEKTPGKNKSVPGGKESFAPVTEEEETDEDSVELDLESIIKELDIEASQEEDEPTEESAVAKYGFSKPVGGQVGATAVFENEKEEEGEDEKEEDEKEGVDEANQKQFKATSDAGKDPEGEKSVSKDKAGFPDGKQSWAPVKEEQEVDLDALLAELDAESVGAPTDNNVVAQLEADNKQLRAQLEAISSDLNEHKTVVTFLKSKLNELNLLNAKLLFTNRLFKQNSLTNSQKMKVIESFDRAKTLREVKLIYTTISESFNPALDAKKSQPLVRKITEGLASRVTRSSKPAVEKAVKESSIIDDGSAARLKQLAGISKK